MIRRKKYTIEEIHEYIQTKDGKCLETIYRHNKHKMRWKCTYDHVWLATFKSIKIQNNWCPKCSGRLNNSLETAKKLAVKRDGVCLSTEYKNNKTNMLWKCNKCNREWLARLDRVKTGTWCPRCRRSHGERLIAEILDRYNVLYKEEVHIKILGRQARFDFFLEEHNLAIEFDGPQHFQVYRRYTPDKKTLEKAQRYDQEKVQYCVENNIRILRIAYNTQNIEKCLLYAINSVDLVIVTDFMYEYILTKLKNIYTILLTGIGGQ